MRYFLSLFWFFSVWGDLEDHFKKVVNKSSGYAWENIDFVYMINLDQRPEKFRLSMDQLAPYGIYPYRFPAVNGWELSLEAINEIGVQFSPEMEGGFMATSYLPGGDGKPSHEIIENFGQTYFVHCLPRGAIGCALSHLSILQDAYDSGYETIWVMEDDIQVMRDPRILPELIDKLDRLVGRDGWDILFTDRDFRNAGGAYAPAYGAAKRPDYAFFQHANDYSFKVDVSSDFRRIANRYGTASMIVRRSGMKKLLQFFKAHRLYLPYDMDLIYTRGIQIYTVSQDVVSNLANALSDVGGPFYLEKKEQLPLPYRLLKEILPFDERGMYINAAPMEKLLKERKARTVVELGSWLGKSTRHIASLLPEGGKVYAVDHWLGSAEHQNSIEIPRLYEQFLSNAIHAKLTDKIIPKKMTTLEAAEEFKANGLQIDVVYVDASHDEASVSADLAAYFPLVQGHGILCGDDWGWGHAQGFPVSTAVTRFAQQHNLRIEVIDGWFWILHEQ